MKTRKLFFTIAVVAMVSSHCGLLSNLSAESVSRASSKSRSATRKTAPIRKSPKSAPKSASKQKPAPRETESVAIEVLDTARNVDYLSEIEKDVILEMNKARTNPKKYAELYIVPFAKKFRSDGTYMKNGVIMLTREGVAAVNECIEEMSERKPVGILRPEKGLALAAQSHATSQAQAGGYGHEGTDGSSPFTRIEKYGVFHTAGENISYGCKTAREIVLQLLVDDGVQNRGHRKNLFNPAFTQTGVGYADGHKVYKAECVITYADGYKEKS